MSEKQQSDKDLQAYVWARAFWATFTQDGMSPPETAARTARALRLLAEYLHGLQPSTPAPPPAARLAPEDSPLTLILRQRYDHELDEVASDVVLAQQYGLKALTAAVQAEKARRATAQGSTLEATG